MKGGARFHGTLRRRKGFSYYLEGWPSGLGSGLENRRGVQAYRGFGNPTPSATMLA